MSPFSPMAPPMRRTETASWNFILGENYLDFIRRKQLGSQIVGDLADIHNASAREISTAISSQTKAILLGINTSRNMSYSEELENLCKFFGQGLATISGQLDMISRGISDLSRDVRDLNSTFQWGFGEVLGALGGIQDSLYELTRAVKNPSKNYSYEKFDDAREAFNRQLYSDALGLLDIAINGDRVSSGYKLEWRFYLLKGIIRLGSVRIPVELIDLGEAEQEFFLAAKYAHSVDLNECAKALLQAGWAAYVQGKLVNAKHYTEQAIGYQQQIEQWYRSTKRTGVMGEAFYQAAKFAMATKCREDGLARLNTAIDLDSGYIIKADTDGDMAPYRSYLLSLFENKRREVLNRLTRAIRFDPNILRFVPEQYRPKTDSGLFILLCAEKEIIKHVEWYVRDIK